MGGGEVDWKVYWGLQSLGRIPLLPRFISAGGMDPRRPHQRPMLALALGERVPTYLRMPHMYYVGRMTVAVVAKSPRWSRALGRQRGKR
jgi:hypothetical protein